MKEIIIPNELKQAIIDNKVIAFVGAGLSYELVNVKQEKILGWSNLVKGIIEHLIQKKYTVDYLLPLLDVYEPIKVLELIQLDKRIQQKDIIGFVKDFFDLDPDKNDFSVHKKITNLFNKIITTNYDTAFELSTPSLRKDTAYRGKNFELNNLKDSKTKILFKLHGCYENCDSMVLFPSDYKTLYENSSTDARQTLYSLENIIYNNTILFIGSGMGDYQIESIFSTIHAMQGNYGQKHFIITDKELDSRLEFLTPIKIDEFSEIVGIIEVLQSIKSEYHFEKKQELAILNEELQNTQNQLNNMQSIISNKQSEMERMSMLLKREALKHIKRGLEHSLENEDEKAIIEYRCGLELDDKIPEAHYIIGATLLKQIDEKTFEEKTEIFEEIFEHYREATTLKSEFWLVYKHWGDTLCIYASLSKEDNAELLYNDAFEKYNEAIKCNPDYHDTHLSYGKALIQYSEVKKAFNNDIEQILLEACLKFERAFELKPNCEITLFSWGFALYEIAKYKKDESIDGLLMLVFEKYEKAIEIKHDYHEAFNNWGNALADYAQIEAKRGERAGAEAKYKLAVEKYNVAISIKPDKYESVINLGKTLVEYANFRDDCEMERIYEDAFTQFRRALEINADNSRAYYGWATALTEYAEFKEKTEKETILCESKQLYYKAIELDPNDSDIYNNLGNNLAKLATLKNGVEAIGLYYDSQQQYEKAISINSDSSYYCNYSSSLICLTRLLVDKEKAEIMDKAYDVSLKCIELGGTGYNFACVNALLGKKDDALIYLDKALTDNDVTIEDVQSDNDWDLLRNDRAYIELIEQHRNLS